MHFSRIQDDFISSLNAFIFNLNATRFQIDALTGIPNRGLIFQMLEKEHSRGLRKQVVHSIAIIDIDFFKKVNDEYGHLAGDRVLKRIAQLFTNSLREYDSIGRYGGEEFLFCMPDTSIKHAAFIMERLRKAIQALSITINDIVTLNITCSIGLSEWDPKLSLLGVISQADSALYSAKNSGRNKVEIWRD